MGKKIPLAMAISGSPCKECENRHPNCHSECKAYLAYKAKCDRITKQKEAERLATPESEHMKKCAWKKSIGR